MQKFRKVTVEFFVNEEIAKKIENLEVMPEIALLNEEAQVVSEPVVYAVEVE